MIPWLVGLAALPAALILGDTLLQLRLVRRARHTRRAAHRLLQARYAGTQAGETR